MANGEFDNLAAALDAAAQGGSFTTLATALDMADLMANAEVGGPFTVFAPTDAAFEQLSPEVLAELLDPAKKEVLTRVLGYHVLPKVVRATDAEVGTVVTVSGEPLDLSLDGNSLRVNDATVTQTDIVTGNGVIHVIDRVLLPS